MYLTLYNNLSLEEEALFCSFRKSTGGMCITGPHGEWLVLFACWNQVSHNLFSNMILQRKTYKQRSWQLSSVGISEPGSRFLLCRGLRESVHQKGEPLEGAPGMMFGDRNMGEWCTPPLPPPAPPPQWLFHSRDPRGNRNEINGLHLQLHAHSHLILTRPFEVVGVTLISVRRWLQLWKRATLSVP